MTIYRVTGFRSSMGNAIELAAPSVVAARVSAIEVLSGIRANFSPDALVVTELTR